jgi:carbamate kinase
MKIVIALGGNALGNTPQEQLKLVKETAKSLADLIEEGHQLVIAHGNGPQVGMIQQAFDSAHHSIQTPMMPFAESGAMSQGYIGYHLQNAIRDELLSRSINKEVVSLITQVVVDENDEAFKKPTKPIGSFYSEEEAKRLEQDKGYTMIEDSGRGYRRVIASPKPVDVVEKDTVNALVDQGVIVITVGGGGIPVIQKDNQHIGVDAVIDKDFASAKVAELVDADFLFILTAVDRVMINFNTPNQKALKDITVEEAKKYISEGHFAPGSMLPKVEAAISFVEKSPNKTSVIAALEKAKEALKGTSGTKIVKE